MASTDRPDYLETLLQAYRLADDEAIRASLQRLPRGGPQLNSDIHTIIKALQCEEPDVRRTADRALEEMGRDAAPILTEMLSFPHERIRLLATQLLLKIGLPDAELGIIKALNDRSELIQNRAIYKLAYDRNFTTYCNSRLVMHIIKLLDSIKKKTHNFYRFDDCDYDTVADMFLHICYALKRSGNSGKLAVPILIDILDTSYWGAVGAAEVLGTICDTASIPSLQAASLDGRSEELRNAATNSLSNIAQLQKTQPIIQTNLDGIAIMGADAIKLLSALDTFRRIGSICKTRNTSTFTFKEMQKQLGLPQSSIQFHIDKITDFFTVYFTRYESDLFAQTSASFEDARSKLFRRQNGVPPAIQKPLGWIAWDLTCRFLDHRDSIDIKRRKP